MIMATAKVMRKIVKIDEAKCDGCGLCVPSCAEGAIRILDGKARLAGDNLCDGLGNCLGRCPQDAITIETRAAEEFEEWHGRPAHESHGRLARARDNNSRGETPLGLTGKMPVPLTAHTGAPHSGCPGSMARKFALRTAANGTAAPIAARPSQLGQWPVQLALVPTSGPIWQGADVLICADCVPFAYPEFHEKLLAGPDGQGKSLAIACPKLDDCEPYVAKLAEIFAANDIKSVTVAHMEVPCCMGLVYAVQAALEKAGKLEIPLHDITVGIDGTIKRET